MDGKKRKPGNEVGVEQDNDHECFLIVCRSFGGIFKFLCSVLVSTKLCRISFPALQQECNLVNRH